MKKLSCLILSMVLCIALAGCGQKSAKSVVKKAIEAFQSADTAAMQPYWGNETLSSSGDDAYSQQLLEQLAKNLTYQITDSQEDEAAGTATVTVELTNVDMNVVLSEWMDTLFNQTMDYAALPADQQPGEDELSKMAMDSLTEAMENHAKDKVTNTVEVSLSREDGAWKMEPSKDVVSAITGGMMDSFSMLGDIFDETVAG